MFMVVRNTYELLLDCGHIYNLLIPVWAEASPGGSIQLASARISTITYDGNLFSAHPKLNQP